jgi:hypothetical protein
MDFHLNLRIHEIKYRGLLFQPKNPQNFKILAFRFNLRIHKI